jgi:CheY-like chemotaxis protein
MSKKILLVEDEPLIGLALQETLERAGYQVCAVIDSADIVPKTVAEHKPDLVILDVRLNSFSDGTDAARRLRLFSNIPIIFLSAYTNPEVIAKAQRSQPIAILTKPVDDSVLMDSIQRAFSA